MSLIRRDTPAQIRYFWQFAYIINYGNQYYNYIFFEKENDDDDKFYKKKRKKK